MPMCKIFKLIFSVILLCLTDLAAMAQQEPGLREPCDSLLSNLKQGWRTDSLGKTGFRKTNAIKLSICKKNKLYIDYLFNMIGRSNEQWTIGEDDVYVYYLSQRIKDSHIRIEYVGFYRVGSNDYMNRIVFGVIER